MKRNSLFTKLLAMMLCVMMVVGCLPLSALAEDDWESDIDLADPIPGSEEDPFEATLGDNTAAEDAADYNWVYTAEYTDTLIITSAAAITVNGTAYELAEDATEVIVELAVTEGDEVKIYSESFNLAYPVGSVGNPIDLTNDLIYEEDFTATVTVPAGTTYNYIAYRVGGMIMTINGGEGVTCTTDGMWYPYAWTITNDGEADAEYVITVAYPEGDANNPAVAYLGDNTASIEAGTQGYFWTYTAEYAGDLIITISGADSWTYAVNNVTAGTYGDTQWSDSDPVVNPTTITVAEGDEIQIMVNGYDPENPWTAPAAELTVNLAYPVGSVGNPIDLTNDLIYEEDFTATVTVPAGTTYNYIAYRVGGMIMTINGGEGVTCTTDGMWYPYAWTITNDGEADAEYVITVAYPEGDSNNPAVAVLGDNTASIAAGTQGYFWTYTAEKAGDLVITISGADSWTYAVNNVTAGTYGDTQWSDSDPVVNPTTITVAEGDEIQIMVNGYDPENPWTAPSAELTVNLAYAPEGPIVDENLKFATISLAFADYIGVQPIMYLSAVSAYDSYYVELVYSEYGVDPVTSVLEPLAESTSSYNVYELAVLPRSMTAGINLTIYAELDGVLYKGVTVETSIEDLALSKLEQFANAGQTARCKILVDMLNYGAAVQARFTDNEAYPNLNLGEYAQYGTTETPEIDSVVTKEGEYTVSVLKDTLGLGSKVEVQFIFKASAITENYELRYVLDGTTYKVAASEFDTESMSGYAVAIFALKPRHFRNEMTIALYDKTTDQPVTQVYTASVAAYALKQVGTANEEAAMAMMKYGDAVIAYFAS